MTQTTRPSHPRAVGGSAGDRQTSTRRVYDLLRADIRHGLSGPDVQLVEDLLMTSLATSRTSVREALQQLADDGLVTRQRKVGTTVSRGVVGFPLDDIVAAGAEVDVLRTDCREVPTTPLLAERLGTDDERLGVVEHLFTTPDGPVGQRVAYYRLGFVQPEAWDACPDLAAAFQHVFGCPLGRIESTVEAGVADAKTARTLGIAVHSPVLVREQLLVDTDGTPQEYTFACYRADRVSFTHTTPGVLAGGGLPGR